MADNPSTYTTDDGSPPPTYIISPHPVAVYVPVPPPPQLMVLHQFYHQVAPWPHYIHPTYNTPFQATSATSFSSVPDENLVTLELENEEVNVAERKGRFKRLLPPRLRRAPTQTQPPSPAPLQQEWRPKKAANADDGSATTTGSCLPTTLMIKNIPNQLRRDFMLKFLDGYCEVDNIEYDFFYLPFDFETHLNVGYAFVNLTTNGGAKRMKKFLNKYKLRGTFTDDGAFISSPKVCEITWATDQGREAQIRRFKKSKFKCDDEEFLPVVFDPPRNGSDPNPPPPIALGRRLPQAY